MKEDKDNENEIVIFENQDLKLEVNMQDETVWLNLGQMTELFGTTRNNITMHLTNVLEK